MSLSEINDTMKLMLDALAIQSGYMQMINKQLIKIQKQNSTLITSLQKLPPTSPISIPQVPLNDEENDPTNDEENDFTNDEYETHPYLVSDDDCYDNSDSNDSSDQEEDECSEEDGNTEIIYLDQENYDKYVKILEDDDDDSIEIELKLNPKCKKQKSHKKFGKKKNTNTVITIPSQTDPYGKEYQINIAYGTCNCPDYEYRHKGNGTYCKHIANVLEMPHHYSLTSKKLTHFFKMIKF